ncbi:MAG: hypothetical protein K9L68_07860 [Spirochaetales bacterium]|nr:hypothetical protein [Spirochaetales bacterium]MCF7938497.1 hypothetical protein [Spirochaetales bacterium]
MKSLTDLNLGTRLILLFSLAIALSLTVIILFVQRNITSLAEEDANLIAENVAERYSNFVTSQFKR